MTRGIRSILEGLRLRLAMSQKGRGNGRLAGRPTQTAVAFFAAALSIGGMSEVLQSAPFAVRKDLEGVQVVRGEKVVASVTDSFAANSLYRLARVVPDSFVGQEKRLFRAEWLGGGSADDVHQTLTLLNDDIREEFFTSQIPFGDLIHEKATKYDVDPALVAAVIEQESSFRTRAVSPKGARGLMQLMPRTGRWMGAKNLHDPEQNVDAGVKYLKYLEKRFNGDLNKTVAAYNAGEGTVKRFGRIPPYNETRTYVKKVMSNYERRKKELAEFQSGGGQIAAGDVAARARQRGLEAFAHVGRRGLPHGPLAQVFEVVEHVVQHAVSLRAQGGPVVGSEGGLVLGHGVSCCERRHYTAPARVAGAGFSARFSVTFSARFSAGFSVKRSASGRGR